MESLLNSITVYIGKYYYVRKFQCTQSLSNEGKLVESEEHLREKHENYFPMVVACEASGKSLINNKIKEDLILILDAHLKHFDTGQKKHH